MSKRTMFWVGASLSAMVSFIAFRGPNLYNKFSPNGYQAFTIAVPNSLLKTAVVSPHDIQTLTRAFNEAAIFATARAVQMKDNNNLKKLDEFLNLFSQYDKEQYEKWREKHPKHI